MQLKNSYSSREVAGLTGLTARQLQWWDEKRLFASAVSPRKTAAGGFTERRYTPVDLLELMVLADLLRQGISVGQIRKLLETLRDRFGIRLFQAIGGNGRLTLLTDGREVYGRTEDGEFFDLLRAPDQPMLELGSNLPLRELTARTGASRKRKKKKPAANR